MKKLKKKIGRWWHGEPNFGSDESSTWIIGPIPHPVAQKIQNARKYWKRNHHWIIPMLVGAVVALFIAAKFTGDNAPQPEPQPTIIYGDEGRRSAQPMPGNNGLRSRGTTRERADQSSTP